jgi:hypothetical protein
VIKSIVSHSLSVTNLTMPLTQRKKNRRNPPLLTNRVATAENERRLIDDIGMPDIDSEANDRDGRRGDDNRCDDMLVVVERDSKLDDDGDSDLGNVENGRDGESTTDDSCRDDDFDDDDGVSFCSIKICLQKSLPPLLSNGDGT